MAVKFRTIKEASTARYTEKMSRFLAFAQPVSTVEEARAFIQKISNEYHDARHVCWAYMIGPERKISMLNDNGEPSGTAGKPILGQINSFELTNIAIAVVRYFGGIKLGTPGLIAAYREAAKLAIEDAEIVERQVETELTVTFPYLAMNSVMKLVKANSLRILEQNFDNTCSLKIAVPKDMADEWVRRMNDIDGAIAEPGNDLI